MLEEMESSLHLEGLLQLMPAVEDMSVRLKQKMIQDPFLDAKGNPYTYADLCRWAWPMGEVTRNLMHVLYSMCSLEYFVCKYV